MQDKLEETRGRIAELEGVRTVKDAATGELTVKVSLTSEQRIEIEALRREMLSIRKQLRAVQRGLREDVERLESWLQFVNIGLVPMIVSGGSPSRSVRCASYAVAITPVSGKERWLEMPSPGLLILASSPRARLLRARSLSTRDIGRSAPEKQEDRLVFPALQRQVDAIADIEVVRPGGRFVLSRHEGGWANMGIGGYPARSPRVDEVVGAMAGLEYAEPQDEP